MHHKKGIQLRRTRGVSSLISQRVGHSYSITTHELHDTRNELADSSKEDKNSDQDIWRSYSSNLYPNMEIKKIPIRRLEINPEIICKIMVERCKERNSPVAKESRPSGAGFAKLLWTTGRDG
jgi:hypothetical protein